jgi:serine/threonine protein kinase
MSADETIATLIDQWLAEADAGRLLSAADLCPDDPALTAVVEERISVLRQFHTLSRPDETTVLLAVADTQTAIGPTTPGGQTVLGPGDLFHKFRIVRELGRGGMGVVFHARDTTLDRDVALKVVRPDVAARPGTTARFLREARAMAALRHDHVVEVYQADEVDGVPFVAMPLLAGETLAERLERARPLPPAEVVSLGRQLAAGLAAVHAKGLVHRDLKPSNVWLDADTGRAKLLDFGLARDAGEGDGVTTPGTVLGTPAYMSPEQANGLATDARSDLFSLGTVLYEAATGKSPFGGGSLTATLAAVGEKDPPPARTVNPAVHAALSDLVRRLHAKRPDDRPRSAAAVAEELERLPTGNVPETITLPAASVPAKSRWWWWPIRIKIAITITVGMFAFVAVYVGTIHKRAPLGPSVALNPTTEVLPSEALPEKKLWPKGDPLPPSPPVKLNTEPNPEPTPRGRLPVRVRSLEVQRFEGINDKPSRPRGAIGKDTFGATLGDEIEVKAELSRPAYAYLCAFRPDGKEVVLFPQDETDVPERTDRPIYPSKRRDTRYVLADGVGLWVVVLIASPDPLPAYKTWRARHAGGPWKAVAGTRDVVWADDGQWLKELVPGPSPTRGEKSIAGKAPVTELVDWLRKEAPGATVSAVGFTVVAKE